MVILGAKGHALEIMDILLYNNPAETFCFFDNISPVVENEFIRQKGVIASIEQLQEYFLHTPEFIIGVGNPSVRQKMATIAMNAGGKMLSAISKASYISKLNVNIGKGVNIMHGVTLHPEVSIGDGTLINCNAIVHHESKVGSFCEICPGAVITGNVIVGNAVFIGAGAILLPGVKIGNNAKIGAGAVVINDVAESITVVGTPARQNQTKEQ